MSRLLNADSLFGAFPFLQVLGMRCAFCSRVSDGFDLSSGTIVTIDALCSGQTSLTSNCTNSERQRVIRGIFMILEYVLMQAHMHYKTSKLYKMIYRFNHSCLYLAYELNQTTTTCRVRSLQMH